MKETSTVTSYNFDKDTGWRIEVPSGIQPKMRTPDFPKKENENLIQVLSIDQTNNTVYLCVNGCRVTALFRDLSNKEIHQRLKEMLIYSLALRISGASLT